MRFKARKTVRLGPLRLNFTQKGFSSYSVKIAVDVEQPHSQAPGGQRMGRGRVRRKVPQVDVTPPPRNARSGDEVGHPLVDVEAVRLERLDAEVGQPLEPRREVAVVRLDGPGRVMAGEEPCPDVERRRRPRNECAGAARDDLHGA